MDCVVDGCVKRVLARGYCSTHYSRWRKHGDPLIDHRSSPALDRFWSKVNRNGPLIVVELGCCWTWEAFSDRDGYGKFQPSPSVGKQYAHRYSYEIENGSIEDTAMEVDHLCRNRSCVNPAHLELVTHAENQRRAAISKTHCPQGHEYDEANTYVSKKGSRSCRQCHADRERSRYQQIARHGVRRFDKDGSMRKKLNVS